MANDWPDETDEDPVVDAAQRRTRHKRSRTTQSYADKVTAVTAELRAATREARETISEMREILKQANELTESLMRDVGEAFNASVVTHVEQLGEATRGAMEASVEKVIRELEGLYKILMGEEDPNPERMDALLREWRDSTERSAQARRQVVPPFWRRPDGSDRRV